MKKTLFNIVQDTHLSYLTIITVLRIQHTSSLKICNYISIVGMNINKYSRCKVILVTYDS